jgi:hypothetical protein
MVRIVTKFLVEQWHSDPKGIRVVGENSFLQVSHEVAIDLRCDGLV